jgi:hypothetical protein
MGSNLYPSLVITCSCLKTIRWAQTYTEVFKDRKHEFVKLVKDIVDQMPKPKA